MLDKLKKMTKGDEERMQHYIQTYIKEMTSNVSGLKYWLEQEDYNKIKTIAHNAKSHFTVMEYDSLWKLANHVETGIHKNYSQEITREQRYISSPSNISI